MRSRHSDATRPRRRIIRHLLWFGAALSVIAVVGVLGYVTLEGWTVVEALYMTVITVSTVGFSEVRPLSEAGRVFTAGLIVAGVGAVTYLFASVSQYIISGELSGSLRERRMQQRIDQLSGHYIICGFGRVGMQVLVDLRGKRKPCVVVEQRSHALEGLHDGAYGLEGDAADDAVLLAAGVERAAGMVVVTGDDATNLFVTLSARTLNPGFVIVARANHPGTEPKLRRAGASHVISPYTIFGRRIARQLLYPSVTDFLDVVMHSGSLELLLEECTVRQGCDLDGKTVEEAHVRRRTGTNVLAIRRRGEDAIRTNPPAEMRFQPGDVLIALGTQAQLESLGRLAGVRE